MQCLPASNAVGAVSASAGSGCQRPQISHVIPLRLFQRFKSERWNFAVCEMLARSAVRELHAELMGLPGLRCCVLGCCVLGCRAQCLAYCAARAVRGCPAAPSPPRVSHLLCREPRAGAHIAQHKLGHRAAADIAVAYKKYSGQVRSASYKSRNQSNLLYTIAASFSIQKSPFRGNVQIRPFSLRRRP